MKRQAYAAVTEIEGREPVTVTKYAHNSALNAAKDALRDAGGTWHLGTVTKTPERTIVRYTRERDGLPATITVTRPTA